MPNDGITEFILGKFETKKEKKCKEKEGKNEVVEIKQENSSYSTVKIVVDIDRFFSISKNSRFLKTAY